MAHRVPSKRGPPQFDDDDQRKRQRRDDDIRMDDRRRGGDRSQGSNREPRGERSPRRMPSPRRDRSPRRARSPGGERDRARGHARDHERSDGRNQGDRHRRTRSRSPAEPVRDERKPPSKESRDEVNGNDISSKAQSAQAIRRREAKERKRAEMMDVDGDIQQADDSTLLKVMGFAKFRSTQNTKVPGNDKLYAVRKEKTTEYRQYMNRHGGFNRPLSPS